MIVFKDKITGDEMFTDAFPHRVVDDFFYEVDGKIIKETEDDSNIDIGANPSAEGGGDEGTVASEKSGCNIVLKMRLQDTQFDSKSYKEYIKGYMKALKEKIAAGPGGDEAAADFQQRATSAVKKILTNFKDYDFYMGESLNPDGMVVLLNFREDGVTPFMLFFKDGLEREKY